MCYGPKFFHDVKTINTVKPFFNRGVCVFFQYLGIKTFTAVSKNLVREHLYFFMEHLGICSKQQAAVSWIEVSVISFIVAHTLCQKVCSKIQSHHMWTRVPFTWLKANKGLKLRGTIFAIYLACCASVLRVYKMFPKIMCRWNIYGQTRKHVTTVHQWMWYSGWFPRAFCICLAPERWRPATRRMSVIWFFRS